jgi:hypothetical protein
LQICFAPTQPPLEREECSPLLSRGGAGVGLYFLFCPVVQAYFYPLNMDSIAPKKTSESQSIVSIDQFSEVLKFIDNFIKP